MTQTTYTPMIMQYLEIKRQHPQEILFYRLGDFYEMFFDDALLASRELEITLTGREGGSSERIPMCGVPYHAADNYIAKLIAKSYSVAICEQVEDAKATKGIVRREVIRIITPGTVLSSNMLSDDRNNFVVLLYEDEQRTYAVACDISTGECLWFKTSLYEQVEDLLTRLQPAEILLASKVSYFAKLEKYLSISRTKMTVQERLLEGDEQALRLFNKYFPAVETELPTRIACGALLEFLEYTQKHNLTNINTLTCYAIDETLVVDAVSLRNLEITRNMRDGSKKDTLFWALDYTCTAMGGRLLKRWLEQPLINPIHISRRQDVVSVLTDSPVLQQQLRESLKAVQDIERLISRIDIGSANARDMLALTTSLAVIPRLKALFAEQSADLLVEFINRARSFVDIVDLIAGAIADEPPLSIRDGGFIRDGYDLELDELRAISKDAKTYLLAIEARERESSGIKSLKIGFNKVFGYYIEITHAHNAAAPQHYIRKQTLANAERYITQELKEFESKILGAHERIITLEAHIFSELRQRIVTEIQGIQDSARRIAVLDALYSLAESALRNNYIRPEITTTSDINIIEGRHPVIELLSFSNRYVPNDIRLDNADNEIMLITGPNMAGKSTYMRQTALLTLMAHTGAFIPAKSATIGIVDKIFTRIGASDDLSSGQSTFMMEMNEVAHILRNATRKSLIVLDEIGRGTSTYDGMSIARAVLEYIKESIRAKTLFATHYHELTGLESNYTGIKNYSVAIKERGNDITFLYRIISGKADKSYGIHVASLAGLPKKLLSSARAHLHNLEACAFVDPTTIVQHPVQSSMTSLFSGNASDTLAKLAVLDVNCLTPLEAINLLFTLADQARIETGI